LVTRPCRYKGTATTGDEAHTKGRSMSTPETTTTADEDTHDVTVRDVVLEDLFRCTVDLCRGGAHLSKQDPVVGRVIADLDKVIRLLRDAQRLDEAAPQA
jgi:hypothetical protein